MSKPSRVSWSCSRNSFALFFKYSQHVRLITHYELKMQAFFFLTCHSWRFVPTRPPVGMTLKQNRNWFIFLFFTRKMVDPKKLHFSTIEYVHRVSKLCSNSVQHSMYVPDMFLPNLQNVTFWQATRCGLAKNCSKTPKITVK